MIIIFLISVVYSLSYPVGISTPFGAIELTNLQIGMEYSLSAIGNPIRVSAWWGSEIDAADMVFELKMPDQASLRKGYEPIPDLSWLEVARPRIPMTSGEEVSTDLIIRIPNDEKYCGKKYQATLLMSAEPKVVAKDAAIAVGVATAYEAPIYITISESPATIEQIKKLKEYLRSGKIKFEVIPMKIYLNEVETGKTVDITKKYKHRIKIINHGERDVKLEINSVDPKVFHAVREGVFDYAPDASWLWTSKKEILLKQDTMESIGLSLKIPKGHENKKYVFLLRVETKDEPIKLGYSIHLYVNTKK